MNKVNNKITEKIVKVVGLKENGLVEMSLDDAIRNANEQGEDVIQVGYSNGVPIVKIEDYNKFLYKEQRKKKELAKKQRANRMELKEIRMLSSIEDHDLNIKVKNIDRLLSDNNKVKVTIIYKGRLIRLVQSGLSLMANIEERLQVKHKIESPAKVDGNRVTMVVSPVK